MSQSKGVLLAVHQQIQFATLLENSTGISTAKLLRSLAEEGLMLQTDDNNICLDASVVYPKLYETGLKLVKDDNEPNTTTS